MDKFPAGFMSMNLYRLFYLNLSHNFLTSTIDQFSYINVNFLDLSFNMFEGQIPSSICNLSHLDILDLSFNNFIGPFPQCLGNSSQELWVLDLGNNALSGTIPTTFSECNMLHILVLNDNQLDGPVPRCLANCTKLELLDLGSNKINDGFPLWLETLPNLQVLILKSNLFHGAIGNCRTGSPFSRLRIVDASYNEFTGVLPTKLLHSFKDRQNDHPTGVQYVAGYTYLYYYYIHSMSLVIKGVEYSLERILKTLTVIDFSSNRFEGQISEFIGTLHSLQLLNLSHNNLSGHIPRTFGNLFVLESLDLSWNQLEGNIPVEILNLRFLGFLNLSENRLVGRIPQGRHFDTFGNESYKGNLALCRLPLTKECGDGDKRPPFNALGYKQDNESEFFDGFTWKAVLLGYSCGLVLGLAMGCLVFLTGKPRWFVQIVEESYAMCKRPRKWIHIRN
ncbi:hypothetical protein ACH5RR_021365 [Cinchona calisaya]|uniref:Receptor-like protein 12 n=1 Tax=Cinchona calisaya TaxID=153742 RepID=A0ABD2ZH38_9GENT